MPENPIYSYEASRVNRPADRTAGGTVRFMPTQPEAFYTMTRQSIDNSRVNRNPFQSSDAEEMAKAIDKKVGEMRNRQLAEAVNSSRFKDVKQLVYSGADVNCSDGSLVGSSACRFQLDITELLLQCGANPNSWTSPSFNTLEVYLDRLTEMDEETPLSSRFGPSGLEFTSSHKKIRDYTPNAIKILKVLVSAGARTKNQRELIELANYGLSRKAIKFINCNFGSFENLYQWNTFNQ